MPPSRSRRNDPIWPEAPRAVAGPQMSKGLSKAARPGEDGVFKPSNKLLAYLQRAQAWGLSPERILEGSGVDWQDVEALKPIDAERTAQLFDFLARRTPPGFALACGQASKVADFGIVGLAMASTATLRDAFGHWSRYSLAAAQPYATSISEAGSEWQMHFSPQRLMTPEAQRFCMEASIAAQETIIEELTGVPPETVTVDFAFERPASTRHYEALRTTAIRFGRASTIYYGKRSDLDRRIPPGDREMADAYQRECENFIARLASSRTIGEKIEDIIRTSVGRIPLVDEMASMLGLSRRSLQRELERSGTTYLDLVKQFRIKHATSLLAHNGFNIKATAFALGFADPGSFRRAFHDWTGQSVAEWSQRAG